MIAVGAGGGCLDFFSHLSFLSFLSLSLSLSLSLARYRLKYCLKEPLRRLLYLLNRFLSETVLLDVAVLRVSG